MHTRPPFLRSLGVRSAAIVLLVILLWGLGVGPITPFATALEFNAQSGLDGNPPLPVTYDPGDDSAAPWSPTASSKLVGVGASDQNEQAWSTEAVKWHRLDTPLNTDAPIPDQVGQLSQEWLNARAVGQASEWPRLGEALTGPARPLTTGVLADGQYLVYLPLVVRPPEPPPWVDTQSRAASREWYLTAYLGSVNSESGWTGNHATCDAGTTSEVFRASILRRINYFRSMAGLPLLVGFDPTYNAKAQSAALMMSVNRSLSHTPTSSWICYTEAGREGAGSSNLYLGPYGPEAISGYIYDPGGGNYFVGHRRWILYPPTQFMGTGDIPARDGRPASNALWVFDQANMRGPRPETRETFVAWPPPGYVPYQVVYPRWSFGYPQADFSQATVMMTRNGQALAVQRNTPVNGYGDNTLVWEPLTSFGSAPGADVRYQVTVSNANIAGQVRSFSYTVTIFNPAH
jgi:hypothetical protein